MKTARMILYIVFMFGFCLLLAHMMVHEYANNGENPILGYVAFAMIALLLSIIRIVDYYRDRKGRKPTCRIKEG